jgi:hypothetical protein
MDEARLDIADARPNRLRALEICSQRPCVSAILEEAFKNSFDPD